MSLAGLDWDDPGWDALTARSDVLLAEHEDAWAAPFIGPGVTHVHFERGLVERVVTTCTAFIDRADAWVDANPLRAIRFRGVAGKAGLLAACEHLRRIERCSIFDSRLTDKDLAEFAQSTFLQRLASLEISGLNYTHTNLGDAGIIPLAGALFFPSLAKLSIKTRGPLSSDGITAIAQAARGDRLETLAIHGGFFDDWGATALADATGLGGLKELSLCGGRLGNEGVIAILKSPRLRGLVSVEFTSNRVNGAVLAALAGAHLPPGLEWIDLRGNHLVDVDIASVERICKRYPNLMLDLRDCKIPGQSQAELAWRGLRGYLDPMPQRGRRTRVSC